MWRSILKSPNFPPTLQQKQSRRVLLIYWHPADFFSIRVFFHNYSWITGLQGKEEGISLTPHHQFYLLHRQLDISWMIPTENPPLLDSNWKPLVSECKSLTTKLCAQKIIFFINIDTMLEPFFWYFQSDAPLAPFLYQKLEVIMWNLMQRLIKKEVLLETTSAKDDDMSLQGN